MTVTQQFLQLFKCKGCNQLSNEAAAPNAEIPLLSSVGQKSLDIEKREKQTIKN